MTVALYARVSSDDQADRETIKDQVLLFDKWVDLHGHQDGGRYLDDGVTGTLPMESRPEGKRLLADIRAGKVATVAFKNVKRLGRKTRVVLDFIDACDQAGATITSITEPFSTADPIGRFIVTILASISELDRENILEQTRAGMRRRAREGGWLGGKCAYGYAIEGRRHQAKIVLDEADSGAGCTRPQLVLTIFEDLASGSSCDAIATGLNARGVPAWGGGAWSSAVISRMIHNPVYRGEHRYGDSIEGSILPESYAAAPRIVSDQLWRRANEQIERNRRLSGKRATRHYLLRGLLWCGTCGSAYTGQTINPAQADATDHAQGVIYRCNGRAAGSKCPSKSISGRIEGEVWEVVVGYLRDPGLLQTAISLRLQQAQTEPPLDVGAQRALADREEQKARLLTLYRRGRITDDELDAQMDDLAAEIATLTAVVEAESLREEHARLARQSAQDAALELSVVADAYVGRLEALTRQERADVLNRLVEKIVVEADGSLRLRLRCNGDTYHQGQINLLQQMVNDWHLPELQAKLLA